MAGCKWGWMVMLMAALCLGAGCVRENKEAAFVAAIEAGDVAGVKAMLAEEPGLIADASGRFEHAPRSALKAAVEAPEPSRAQLVAMLLNAGADPNECFNGWIPVDAMQWLLKAGVRQALKDEAMASSLNELGWARFRPADVKDVLPQRAQEEKQAQQRVAMLRKYGAGAGLWDAPVNLSFSRLGTGSRRIARWDSPEGPRLVLFGLSQTGSWMIVVVVDKEFNITRIGATTVKGGGPADVYALAEVRVTSAKMPAVLRDRWLLAAAGWRGEMDVTKPIYFVGRPDGGEKNVLPCSLIHWVWSEGTEATDFAKVDFGAVLYPGGAALAQGRPDFRAFDLELTDLDLEVKPAELGAPAIFQAGKVKGKERR